jgi:beta-glucosidase
MIHHPQWLWLHDTRGISIIQFFYLGGVAQIPDDFDIESIPPEHRAYAKQPVMVEAAIRNGRAGAVLFVKDAACGARILGSAV